MAPQTASLVAGLPSLEIQLAVHATGGLLVLLAATALSVYKPWGPTPYGRRKQHERREGAQPTPRPSLATSSTWKGAHPSDPLAPLDVGTAAGGEPGPGANTGARRRPYVLLGVICLLLLVVGLHLAGNGIGGH